MDALRAWMESDLDVIMVATMDARRAWMGSDLDVIMVGTWMLCGHGCWAPGWGRSAA